MRVCIGGTFNILHKGHMRLIDEALGIAGKDGFVFIGVAIGELAAHKKKVKSFSNRKDQIIRFITKQKKAAPTVLIEPIANRFGPTLERDFDVIVVSAETKAAAREINKKRVLKGKKEMKIVQIPTVFADDGKPISSTRISKGKITKDGRVIPEKTSD